MPVAQPRARLSALGRQLAALIAALALVGCANSPTGEGRSGSHPSPIASPSVQPSVQASVQPSVQTQVQPSAQPADQPWLPGPLTEPGLDLLAGPVDVPLELRIPSLKVKAPVIGVGITSMNVMDAPKGPLDDPVWQSAFWYRGSGLPGAVGTATLAGHVNDPLARPGVFARLKDLRPGDLIIVHDLRSGRAIEFTVISLETYTAQQASDPSILAQIYGAGPVAGQGPQPAPDGLAHLTLITCAGNIVDGAFDRYIVVYATRTA